MLNERGGGEGVFNRLTQSGREAVALAGSEAKGLGHNYLGTEHLLLGVLNTELGTHVLGRLGLTLEVARSDVVGRIGSVPESDREATAALPSTPRTMDVLVVAWQEARSENYIGSEHILRCCAKGKAWRPPCSLTAASARSRCAANCAAASSADTPVDRNQLSARPSLSLLLLP